MAGFARGGLRRRILRDARGLAPSIELPWTPPWGDELPGDLADLVVEVHVLQADVVDARTWHDDASGAQRRSRIVDTAGAAAASCDARSLRSTAHALREIAASIRAWDALGPRS